MFKRFLVIVESSTGLVKASNEQVAMLEEDLVTPEVPEGHTLVFLDEALFTSTFGEFLQRHKPVMSAGEVTGWEERHSGMTCSISATPKNDGSNTPFISMCDGLPGSAYKASPSRGLILNSSSEGRLDDTGDGSFRVKVTDGAAVRGSVLISPRGHQDFVPVTFDFDVEAGDF